MAKAKIVVVPQCEVGVCGDGGGQAMKAEFVVPQKVSGSTLDDTQWEFVMVCEFHARGWWSGSDVPAYRRPQSYSMYEHDLDLSD